MKKALLLIEDDVSLQRMYRRVFEHSGYTVLQAVDGVEGWEVAKKTTPDLILLDIMMPKLDGLQLLKRLKDDSDTREITVIVLTNLDNDTAIRECLKLGAIDYLVKSRVDIDQLVEKTDASLPK